VEVVTGILRKISHPELKSIFDYCVYGCDWITIHEAEYYQE
jgi:hypothetical protein